MTGHVWARKGWTGLWAQLNWFRIHLLAFTIIPFVFSGFFMAANPSAHSAQYIADYIDALFMCFSAMTVTGLSTLSVSELRPAQQAFLLILMLIGDISIVSLLTIFCRQLWFMRKCRAVVGSTVLTTLHAAHKAFPTYDDANRGRDEETGISLAGTEGLRPRTGAQSREVKERRAHRTESDTQYDDDDEGHDQHPRRLVHGTDLSSPYQPTSNLGIQPGTSRSLRTPEEQRHLLGLPSYPDSVWAEGVRRRAEMREKSGRKSRPTPPDPHSSIPHASSRLSLHTGRGGFPGLHELLFHLLHKTFPRFYTGLDNLLRTYESEGVHSSHPIRALGQILEKPLEEHRNANEDARAKRAKWLPPGVRGVVVGRNSQFFEEELSDEDLELIGALEYRATTVLTILLILHQLFWMLIPAVILAIYFAKVHAWDDVFLVNSEYQSATVSKTWYSFFQVVSAYTSCGLSLVDTLMVPFQKCYLLSYVLIFPMLAGNQAIPLFLRAELWLLTKVVKPGSELEVSLHFLLTHSRRLFLYLFPAYQTWYLVAIQFGLTITGVLAFVAFEHGLPYYQSIGSAWESFTVGLFESLSVRASGFGIVFVSDLAPSTAFFYLMLIFTCNYPLVMAIRSTNVYEERALGLHGEHAPGQHNGQKQNGEIFSKYLRYHLLPQIFFDLWPVAVGTLFICILERGKLMNSNNAGWLGVWQILFEVTSGYATVGLSYGNPYNTSSLSASFRKISKLIMILIMLRGRHRGLPLAIDRAIMYPTEYLRLTGAGDEKVAKNRVHAAGEAGETQ